MVQEERFEGRSAGGIEDEEDGGRMEGRSSGQKVPNSEKMVERKKRKKKKCESGRLSDRMKA